MTLPLRSLLQYALVMPNVDDSALPSLPSAVDVKRLHFLENADSVRLT